MGVSQASRASTPHEPSLEEVAQLVSKGTCEGIEGIEFSSEQLAGQYAFEAVINSDYKMSTSGLEAHLDILHDAGAIFDYPATLKYTQNCQFLTHKRNTKELLANFQSKHYKSVGL